MKNLKFRGFIAVLVAMVGFLVGYLLLNTLTAIGDVCMGLIYVAAIIAGGTFWIGINK